MNIEQLKTKLEEERIFKGLYSFFNDGDSDGFVLTKDNSNWLVYCTDRGEHYSIKKFENENEACQYLLNELQNMPSARYKVFAAEDFEQFPIWAGNENKGYRPISGLESAKLDDNVLIKSSFTTNGYHFNGYIIGKETFRACGLFVMGRQIRINTDPIFDIFTQDNLAELYTLFKCKKFDFFPLRYQSQVRREDGQFISGALTMNLK